MVIVPPQDRPALQRPMDAQLGRSRIAAPGGATPLQPFSSPAKRQALRATALA